MPPQLAPHPISDTASRALTRVILMYSLGDKIVIRSPGAPLTDLFDFGRFSRHIRASGGILPSVTSVATVPAARFVVPGCHLIDDGEVTVSVLTSPRCDSVMIVECRLSAAVTVAEVADFLATTCFHHDRITLDGMPLSTWVRDRLARDQPDPAGGRDRAGESGSGAGDRGGLVAFGTNVHQIVFPGAELFDQIVAKAGERGGSEAALATLVRRGTVHATRRSGTGVWVPEALHDDGATIVAHGRGVSVVAGWAVPVENCLATIAVVSMLALATLQRTRVHSFEVLAFDQRATIDSPEQASVVVATLADHLSELQLDLSLGVDAYTDSLLISELVAETYQTSLNDALGIRISVENSSRMLERITSVIHTRSAHLESLVAKRAERRMSVVQAMITVATLIAIPPALLLAFFGTNSSNVDASRSIFDLGFYWPAYTLVWSPFLLLVALQYYLRARLRRREARAPKPSMPPVPAPPRSSLVVHRQASARPEGGVVPAP